MLQGSYIERIWNLSVRKCVKYLIWDRILKEDAIVKEVKAKEINWGTLHDFRDLYNRKDKSARLVVPGGKPSDARSFS